MPLTGSSSNAHFIQQLMRAYAKGQSGMWLKLFYPCDNWRYNSLKHTLTTILDPKKHQTLVTQAQKNMLSWQKNSIKPPLEVSVTSQDWGTACLEATRQYGQSYAVLNNASRRFPGGAFLNSYGAAQEENMWRRSDCALSLAEEHVCFDAKNGDFSYDEYLSKLIAGEIIMSPEEQRILAQRTGVMNPNAHRVYLSEVPRICFRGPECLVDQHNPDEVGGKNTIQAEPDLSFLFLAQNDIFPFYELRSAAPDFSTEIHQWDKEDPKCIKKYKESLQQCIAAQLDTLIHRGKKQIILGAWGCGDFNNDPHIVAKIYRDEINKRAGHFQHIVFAILNTASHHGINYGAFKAHLDGLTLGSKATTVSVPSSMESKTPKM